MIEETKWNFSWAGWLSFCCVITLISFGMGKAYGGNSLKTHIKISIFPKDKFTGNINAACAPYELSPDKKTKPMNIVACAIFP